jgi:ABC-type multidrug transport system ATPase subunit
MSSNDIEIKGKERRLLDHVSWWVKPGTLTQLMGASGAGKTTLFDVLAQRTTVGVVTGDMLVNGRPLRPTFSERLVMFSNRVSPMTSSPYLSEFIDC